MTTLKLSTNKAKRFDRAAAFARFIALFIACSIGTVVAEGPPPPESSAASPPDKLVDIGRRIYNEGITSAGGQLKGVRLDHGEVLGPQAACVNCHRPSGMGQYC